MKTRFRLIRRGSRGGSYYLVDTQTGRRSSLGTVDRDGAEQVLHARNEAERQPMINLQIAKAYLAAADSDMMRRTWREALHAIAESKHPSNRARWLRVEKDRAFADLLPRKILETKGALLFEVMRKGTCSTNSFLRRLHNFCLDMNWLPWPLIPKRQWPQLRYKQKRAITWEEHARIVEREHNPERKAFYQLAWHIGASQSDLAHLQAEDVDWPSHTITYVRMKTRWLENQVPPQIRFGQEVEAILQDLPSQGPLFPYLRTVEPGARANEFRERCRGLGIHGVSLHSYRYAWAERAKIVGYPERFAQMALGHNSKAVHRAYARNARMTLPPLEDYERNAAAAPVIPLPPAAAG